MKEKNIDTIRGILEGITIREDRSVIYKGEIFDHFQLPTDSKIGISMDMLRQNLQTLIYTGFYCKSNNNESPEGTVAGSAPVALSDDLFIQMLSDANQTKEDWDLHWQVDSTDPAGTLLVKKSNHTRNTYPGEFIKESHVHGHVKPGDPVKIIKPREFNEPGDAFYFALGSAMTEDISEWLVRFYFHISPDGACGLLRDITGRFNRYQIPFTFKCLSHPLHYHRSDSAVLYIDRRYFDSTCRLLAGMYQKHSAEFKSGTPLFTRTLAPGLGFAENPPDPAESFGMNRSRLIATAMINNIQQTDSQLQDHERLENTIAFIEAAGYDLEHFYLNPGSAWPYPFGVFDKPF